MVDKRQALADFIADNLGQGWKIEQRLREKNLNSDNRLSRIAVMGDPAKYVEVLWRGADQPPVKNRAGNVILDRIHSFDVMLWFQYKDAENYQDSSQAQFDSLVESQNGLLNALSELPYFTIDGKVRRVLGPTSVDVDEVILDGQGEEIAHYLSFNMTIM